MNARRILWTIFLAVSVGTVISACGPSVSDPGTQCGELFCSHGTCDDSSGEPMCVCDEGYAGLECNQCAQGYTDAGGGTCRPQSQCEIFCASEHRECVTDGVDPQCGDCIDGYHEDNGQCLETCAEETTAGEIIPLDLFIMLDRSSSMTDAGKWTAVVNAIQTFIGAPDASGIGVGLQFFPVNPTDTIPTDCAGGCGLYGPCLPGLNVCAGSLSPDTSCDPADYDTALVDIQPLPGVQSMIMSALSGTSPDGSATPTQPAMNGAVAYAVPWAQSHPDHLTFIVLATDGEPTGCTTNSISGTAALATSAAAANPSVKTFVIGVGSELASLNTIASAGGTGQAYLVDTGGNVTQGFIDALNEIRANALCKYRIPQPTNGTVDFTRINVRLTDPMNSANDITIPNVGTEAGCITGEHGWYYDDPMAPTQIVLCPASCNAVTQNNWEVDVLVGCTTIVD